MSRRRVTDWIAYIIVALSVFGCNADYHVAKAIKKGAKFGVDTVEVPVKVPVIEEGDTTYLTKYVKAPCPEVTSKLKIPTSTKPNKRSQTIRPRLKRLASRIDVIGGCGF
jgi:hypothetical protein